MRRIGGLSDEMRPVLSDLGDVAPDINRMLIELGPFSEAGIPAVESLGEAGEIGIPAMRDALPVTKDLRRLREGRDAGRRDRGGRARVVASAGAASSALLDYVFYQVAAINGFDSFGHYLRARLILNTCSRYYTEPVDGCSSRFASAGAHVVERDRRARPPTPTRSCAAPPPRCRARIPTASRRCPR